MAKMKELREQMEISLENAKFYKRMAEETVTLSDKEKEKIDSLENRKRVLKESIKAHSNEPLYRRGLADEYFELERINERLIMLYNKLNGINSVGCYARERMIKSASQFESCGKAILKRGGTI